MNSCDLLMQKQGSAFSLSSQAKLVRRLHPRTTKSLSALTQVNTVKPNNKATQSNKPHNCPPRSQEQPPTETAVIKLASGSSPLDLAILPFNAGHLRKKAMPTPTFFWRGAGRPAWAGPGARARPRGGFGGRPAAPGPRPRAESDAGHFKNREGPSKDTLRT